MAHVPIAFGDTLVRYPRGAGLAVRYPAEATRSATSASIAFECRGPHPIAFGVHPVWYPGEGVEAAGMRPAGTSAPLAVGEESAVSSQPGGEESAVSSQPGAGTFAYVPGPRGGCAPAETGGHPGSTGAAEPWLRPGSAVPGGGSGEYPGSATLLPLQADSQVDYVQFGLSEEAQTLLDALETLPQEEEVEEALLPSTERGVRCLDRQERVEAFALSRWVRAPPGHPLSEL